MCCQKEYLFINNSIGSFEVFRIENNKSEKIFYKKIKKEEEQEFDDDFLTITINYFNKKYMYLVFINIKYVFIIYF